MQKYGNVSFATVVCAKCMRYGGGTIPWGGVGIQDPDSYIRTLYIRIYMYLNYMHFYTCVYLCDICISVALCAYNVYFVCLF